jgi:hypothetical protein
MTDQDPSEFERLSPEGQSLWREVLEFLAHEKKWWLLPILAVLLLVGLLVLLSGTAGAPFIYTLF